MELNDIVQKINAVDTQLALVKKDVLDFVKGQSTGAIPVTVEATATPPNPLYEVDANKMLTHFRAYANARVDPVVGPDCPNTRTLPKTGHTLSLPRIDLGEMFMGYTMRVSDQISGGVGKGDAILSGIGALFMGTSTFFAKAPGGVFNPDGSNWPEAADCYANMRAYMTPEELARDDAAKAGWKQWDEEFKKRAEEQNKPKPDPVVVPPGDLPPGETPL